ncbi:MAG: N-acetylmuramoyl-L-alanine amidase AmiB [Gammaproteobacteria bacterium]|nr:MAG: N-acetylmuramoyl-L-alanine amidase AmiB [Gammaproteobacteria bacterium]
MRLVWVPYIILISGLVHAGPASVDNVRVWAAPDHTRVVFDVSSPVEHRLFTLRNPDRVVIDVSNATRGESLGGITNIGLVERVRTGINKDKALRIVLDLKGDVKPKSFLLRPNGQYGHRLVIDLWEAGGKKAQPVKTAKQIEKAGPRKVVVAIDAGHGGEDPGARGASGLREKYITLAIARKLALLVNQQRGMKAVLLRDGDYYLGLRSRMAMARENHADVFISIHADAFRDSRVNGSSVYMLSERGASSEAAKWLADKENSSDLIGGVSGGVSLDDKDALLRSVLLDLSQNATLEASAWLAHDVLEGLKIVGKVHKRRVERAGFAVLKSPDIPSILVETAFISNPKEERRLRNKSHQNKLAQSILNGVKTYLKRYPPPGTRFARSAQQVAQGSVK